MKSNVQELIILDKDQETLRHGGVATRSMEKAQEWEKRVQAIKEASRRVLTRSKAKPRLE